MKINAEVYDLFGQLVEKNGTCTEAVHLLPRPYTGMPSVKWAAKQVRRFAKPSPAISCRSAANTT